MTRDDSISRRTVLRATSAVTLGAPAIAGCSGGGSEESGGGGSGGGSGGSGGGDSDGGSGGSGSGDFGGWMENVGNYEGIVDRTGKDEVTVMVGTEGNGGNYAFSPAAVEVSTGTTVVWEWTGEGQQHNVVDDGGDFESELTDEEGFTFSHTFESAGTTKYYCEPHEALGMKGAVVVK